MGNSMKHTSLNPPQSRLLTSIGVAFLVATSILALPLQSFGQQGGVTTKLTSSGLGTDIVPPLPGGTVYNINGGTVRTGATGNNLFHSFGEFSVGAGDIARFNNTTTVSSIANILARVTGENLSSISRIYGTVESTINGANLFLMNPNGFVLGPNASFQVGGSVHITTANAIVHTNGIRFDLASTTDTLTAAPIAAFGFLGESVGSILVQGSQLAASTGKTLSLIGGNVEIQAGILDDGNIQPARLTAPSGQINVAGVLSAGDISLTTLEMTPAGVGTTASLGSISITQQSLLDAGGSPGGTVRIRGGQFTLDRSTIAVSHTGGDTAGEINIAADAVNLIGGAQIVSTNSDTSSGPAITVAANDSVSIQGFDSEGTLTGIVLSGFGPVPSGIISTTSSSGTGGKITITRQGSSLSPSVTLEEGGAIASMTSGSGSGGDLVLTHIKSLDLKTGGQITSTSGMFDFETGEILGSGPGGRITIQANESVTVNGGQLDLFQQSAIFSSTNTIGKGGDISIFAPTIGVGDSGAIVTSSGAGGAGGAITISDFTQLTVSGFTPEFLNSWIVSAASSEGTGGHITLSSSGGTVLVDQLGVIRSNNTGFASGGDVTLSARDIMVTNGGAIEAGATSSTGASGKVTLAAGNDVQITGQTPDPLNPDAFARSHVSNIVSGVDNQSGSNGGIIITATNDVLVEGGGRIESITGPGGGGGISVSADHAITLSDPLTIGLSTLDGSVGSLNIQAPAITLRMGAGITSSSASNTDAGEILLKGDVITLTDASTIRSNTEQGTGRGGSITVDAEESVLLSGGSSIQSSTTTSQGGPAGSVTVMANNLVSLSGTGTALLSESGSSASLGTGPGGTITVKSGQVQVTDGAVVSAKSNGSGAAGNVMIQGTSSPAQSIMIDGPGSGLFTETQGTGKGGDITAWANEVRLTDHSTISAKTTGSGNAGNILVKADAFSMSGAATITAASTGTGNAGSVTIQGTASPAVTVAIDGTGSGIFTSTENTGAGGNILIESSQSTTLTTGAAVSASSTGTMDNAGDAGMVTIHAGDTFLMQNAAVTTQATKGGGGQIEIVASDLVRLINSKISSSVLDGSGGGGNITIDPNSVILQNSQILAQAVQGNGGNITITTPVFLADPSSLVDASSQFGLNGTVNIQSPTSNLSGTVGQLSSKTRQMQTLLQNRCAALAGGEQSTFILAGRDTLPAEPGGWLGSPFAFAALSGETGTSASSVEPREARGEGDNAGLEARGKRLEGSTEAVSFAGGMEVLSLRRMTPPGFLIQAFATDGSTGCHS